MKKPFLGIISATGYVEYYDVEIAKENDYHHSFCLSEEGLKQYDNDDTLRFIVYSKEHGNAEKTEISILGNPALDPFGTGREQLRKMANIFKETEMDLSIPIRVENHFLNTQYEDKVIGSVATFL